MSIPEIIWRLQQARIKRKERAQFAEKSISVTAMPFAEGTPKADFTVLGLQDDIVDVSIQKPPALLGSYLYEDYAMQWHAGFQTEHEWPMIFSYDLPVSGREDIGDVRMTWELNRHHAFAWLAKEYCRKGDTAQLQTLRNWFFDWVEKNPVLHGVAWTSPMEVAIRAINWIYMAGFLQKAQQKYSVDLSAWLEEITAGIWNMCEYVRHHRSRYSSANNHLLVEMVAVAYAGIIFRQERWLHEATAILSDEIVKQNAPDGVNREMSLHYQAFGMEAYGLLISLLHRAGIPVPEVWIRYLTPMAQFVADSMIDEKHAVQFGDSDEGKLLQLSGGRRLYEVYILQLMSLILPERFGVWKDDEWEETLRLLFCSQEMKAAASKPLYEHRESKSYREGGYTFLRQRDTLLAVDHAPLGYGSIAAHGHADALSIQLFVCGVPFFVDEGTFTYHVPRERRLRYCSTGAHNTVYVDGLEQAEMLGPFLWGRRPATELIESVLIGETQSVLAQTRYEGITQIRSCQMCADGELRIEDEIRGSGKRSCYQRFLLPDDWEIQSEGSHRLRISQGNIQIGLESNGNISVQPATWFPRYGIEEPAHRLVIQFDGPREERKEIQTILKRYGG